MNAIAMIEKENNMRWNILYDHILFYWDIQT